MEDQCIPRAISDKILGWVDKLDEVRSIKEMLFRDVAAGTVIQRSQDTWDLVIPSLVYLSEPSSPYFVWDDLTIYLIDDPDWPGDMAAGTVVFSTSGSIN